MSANPIKDITEATGDWTLRFLLLTIAVTPIRRVTGWHGAIRYRRMLGLFAFFYALLHLATYVWLDQFFDWGAMLRDIGKRRFITAGLTAFLCLLPLALTSTKGMVRRLGGKRWQRLHRLVYAAAAAGVIHYYWLVKADVRRPLLYALAAAILLGARVVWRLAAARRRAAPGAAPS